MQLRKTGTSTDGRLMHYSAGVVVKSNGKYLLVDRIKPPFGFAGPAGHVDEGEDPKTACIRELKEETGIIVDDMEFMYEEEISWNYCKTAEVHYWHLYKVSVDSEDVVLEKEGAKSIGWYTVEEMKTLNLEKVWRYWFEKMNLIQ